MRSFSMILILVLATFPVKADPYMDAAVAVTQEFQGMNQYCEGDPGCVCYYVSNAYEGSHTNYANLSTQVNPFWAQVACIFWGCFAWDGAYSLFYWYYSAMEWGQYVGSYC